MNSKSLVIALLLLGGSAAWAQPSALYNAELSENNRINDPAKAVKAVEGQWLAFSMPVIEGSRSPCCWSGKWGVTGEFGCSLETSYTSFGSRADSPLVDSVIVYGKIIGGGVQSMRVFGEACPVDGNGEQVTWLGGVKQSKVLDWLEDTAGSQHNDGALYVLSLHHSDDAAKRLYNLAKNGRKKNSSEAIFWLGEARGKQGFEWLERLLVELPAGDQRREINFALSQNDTDGAAELLLEIARSDTDREQRGEAMFWLAEGYPQQAGDWLREIIGTEQDEDLLEKAVFAVSQLPGKQGSRMLLDIATDKQAPKGARRQALFWLTQSDDDEAVAALADLLTR